MTKTTNHNIAPPFLFTIIINIFISLTQPKELLAKMTKMTMLEFTSHGHRFDSMTDWWDIIYKYVVPDEGVKRGGGRGWVHSFIFDGTYGNRLLITLCFRRYRLMVAGW